MKIPYLSFFDYEIKSFDRRTLILFGFDLIESIHTNNIKLIGIKLFPLVPRTPVPLGTPLTKHSYYGHFPDDKDIPEAGYFGLIATYGNTTFYETSTNFWTI